MASLAPFRDISFLYDVVPQEEKPTKPDPNDQSTIRKEEQDAMSPRKVSTWNGIILQLFLIFSQCYHSYYLVHISWAMWSS